jgi:chromate transporter
VLFSLFWLFFKVGLISFGGGYAVLSVIEHEVAANHWMTAHDYAEAVALAGMSPGPIATNIAALIGYRTTGFGGAAIAVAGMILPSMIVVVALALFLYRATNRKWMDAVLYGLKPMVCALILYAAVRVGLNGQPVPGFNGHTMASVAIFTFAIIATVKFHMHPFIVLSLSALLGIAIFI